MKRTSIVGIFSIATMASVLMPLTVTGQQKSLKDQLVGTWSYVSSTAKHDDGSYEPRPSSQGAVMYTADGRFRGFRCRDAWIIQGSTIGFMEPENIRPQNSRSYSCSLTLANLLRSAR